MLRTQENIRESNRLVKKKGIAYLSLYKKKGFQLSKQETPESECAVGFLTDEHIITMHAFPTTILMNHCRRLRQHPEELRYSNGKNSAAKTDIVHGPKKHTEN